MSLPSCLPLFTLPLSYSRPVYECFFFHSGALPELLLPNQPPPPPNPHSKPPSQCLAGSQALIFGGPAIDTGCLWLGCLAWFISVTLVMVWCGGCTHVHIMTQWARVERRGWSGEVSIGSFTLPVLFALPSISLSFFIHLFSHLPCSPDSFAIIWNDFVFSRNDYLTLNVPLGVNVNLSSSLSLFCPPPLFPNFLSCYRTRSDTTCPYTVASYGCKMKGQGRVLGGCWTQRVGRWERDPDDVQPL